MDGGHPIVPVILSGGSGTRLWPLSREHLPKQLLPLLGPRTLLQETLLRARAATATPPVVVCNHSHRFLVAEQARDIGGRPGAILLEPMARNTAPAIAVAAHEARRLHGANVRLLVMPADHVMADVPAFVAAVSTAARVAEAERAVTFGIVATRPETGFGYLEAGAAIEGIDGALNVAAFVEKPDRARAETFLAGGRHFWNSGMFLFPAELLLERLQAFEADMAACATEAWERSTRDEDFVRIDSDAFGRSPSNSVDYAVMER
ncbi:MAG: mannose-1-phosphate guanylyltransferase/mannose-6-phosphate isomerase, partial [Gammaproteobacteria bacterium]